MTEEKLGRVDDLIDREMLHARRILISAPIDGEIAKEVIRKLWYLETQDSSKPILLIINSPGGSVDAGFAIWDQLKMIRSPIFTLVTGLAASFGSVLSLAAKKGRRFASPMARIMIHQPLLSGVIKGQATDLEIQAKQMLKTRNLLIDLYADATGRNREEINQAIDRDMWMSAEEAKEFGLIDKIVANYEELAKDLG